MEPIIVVSGIKTKSPNKIKILWIEYLIFMNSLFYFYKLFTNDYSKTSDFVLLTFFYILIGLYLPMYGRKCIQKNKNSTKFTIWQGFVSTYQLMTYCGNVVVYYTVNNLCHQCLDIFSAGHEKCTVQWANNDVNLSVNQCFQIPNERDFMINKCIYIFLSIIGIITAIKVSINKKEDIVEAIQITDPVVIDQILNQIEAV
jgi:hypothetical protein